MLKGKIVTWNRDRGFGFVKRDDNATDVFVHARHLNDRSRDYLAIGTNISFDLDPSDNSGKPRAINVSVLDDDNARRHRAPLDAAQALFQSV